MESLCRSKQAPFEYTLEIINGKWKLRIIYELGCEATLRYGALKRSIPHITHKILSTQLKELKNDGLIIRKEYPQIPPRVEYALSEKGLSIFPIIFCQKGLSPAIISYRYCDSSSFFILRSDELLR
ncbi:winged helix-turn-helix transcriptional regulator [Methylomusa anaerophila]|uniref:HTH-type transcriptional activator HxlR n=1 Tax=Methylomusa anaerophila TaxID=1930071 RepID=A0A348AQZ9_9FIRM|nr:helix-turn-helix domain-containing protein [Methylomusa anaerophila]BBB93497.1 HTH-type transcriptional activator HxlR [Methylomusa anaerophila]